MIQIMKGKPTYINVIKFELVSVTNESLTMIQLVFVLTLAPMAFMRPVKNNDGIFPFWNTCSVSFVYKINSTLMERVEGSGWGTEISGTVAYNI